MTDKTGDDDKITLTRFERKLIDAAAAASLDEITPESRHFLHAVLCQVGLPKKHPDARVFERYSGAAGIRVEAGSLYKSGQYVEQGLPYGVKPRLALIHLCTEAMRTRSPVVPIGDSIKEFLVTLGLSIGGRSYGEMKRQMERLAACRMQIGVTRSENRFTTDTLSPVRRFDAWLTYDGNQRSLWPGELELSLDFLETLFEHGVPLRQEHIRALQESALALDIYTWLAHRLCRVRNKQGEKVSWGNLRDQFGQEYRCSKDFKKKFKKELRKVLAVYHDARVEEVPGGLMLRASAPPIPKTQVLMLHKVIR